MTTRAALAVHASIALCCTAFSHPNHHHAHSDHLPPARNTPTIEWIESRLRESPEHPLLLAKLAAERLRIAGETGSHADYQSAN